MSEPTEREFLEGLRYEDKFPDCGVDMVEGAREVVHRAIAESWKGELYVWRPPVAEIADVAAEALQRAGLLPSPPDACEELATAASDVLPYLEGEPQRRLEVALKRADAALSSPTGQDDTSVDERPGACGPSSDVAGCNTEASPSTRRLPHKDAADVQRPSGSSGGRSALEGRLFEAAMLVLDDSTLALPGDLYERERLAYKLVTALAPETAGPPGAKRSNQESPREPRKAPIEEGERK